jgi:hypothetical protein
MAHSNSKKTNHGVRLSLHNSLTRSFYCVALSPSWKAWSYTHVYPYPLEKLSYACPNWFIIGISPHNPCIITWWMGAKLKIQ